MKELAELFGGMETLLIIRHFLRNPRTIMTNRMIGQETSADGRSVRAVLANLSRAGLIVEVASRPEKKKITKRPSAKTIDHEDRKWRLNSNAPYLSALQHMLKPSSTVTDEEVASHFASLGKIQMLVLSGMFLDLGEGDSGIDLLVVADKFNEEKADKLFESFENGLGEEVRYTILTTTEYQYRKEVRDKMLREFFTLPHRIVINKLGRI